MDHTTKLPFTGGSTLFVPPKFAILLQIPNKAALLSKLAAKGNCCKY